MLGAAGNAAGVFPESDETGQSGHQRSSAADGAAYQLLNASAKQNINVDAFDPKAGAAASDEEDGDLTDKILVEGSANTEKDGEYTLMYSVTDSESASYAVKRVVTVKEKSEPTEPTKPTEPSKPTEPTKPGDTVQPNTPDAGNKQPGLSKPGASVSGVCGAFAALLAVGAGAALVARRRREPRR